MNRRDIVIGVGVLLLIGGLVFYWRQKSTKKEQIVVPAVQSVQDKIEEKFKYQIPENVDKAELKDVTGGNASAIATREYQNQKYSSTFLADLPDPEAGTFYQAWLVKGTQGQEGYSIVSLGKLVIAKGGWMIDFSSQKDYTSYDKVMVTKETIFDNTFEKTVLEGSF